MREFLAGVRTPFLGWSMLQQHRSLKVRLVIPYLIISVLFFTLCYFFWAEGIELIHAWTDGILEAISLDVDAKETMRWFQKLLFYPLYYLLKVLFYLIATALVMLMTLLLGNILLAFFWELIIEKVFVLYGKEEWVFEDENIFQKIITPLLREIVKEVMYVVLFIVVWVVTIVPVIGPVLSLILGPPAICFWFGFIICDFSMSVMAANVGQRFRYGSKHWMYLTGMGVYALIPVVGLFVYPLFVLGHAKNMTELASLYPPKDLYGRASKTNRIEESAEKDI